MKKILLAIVALLLSFSIIASDNSDNRSEEVTFVGQTGDAFSLSWDKMGTLYRPVDVPDTCYHQIPYQTTECRNVTRYRNECRTIPGYQDCDTVYDTVCRNVTRYRQECTTGPSRQSCTTTPVRRVCRDIPTRNVCRTNGNGQQVCQTVGGGQTCHNTGGDRRCQTIPGERTCRQVPYTDRDCDRVARQQCRWIPDREHCENVPYSDQVCEDVTRYRDGDAYACTRTIQQPYQAVVKKYRASVEINYIGSTEEEIKFKVDLTDEGKIALKMESNPVNTLVFLESENHSSNEVDDVTELNSRYIIKFMNKDEMEAPFKTQMEAAIKVKEQKLVIKTGKIAELNGYKMTVILQRKARKDAILERTFLLSDNKAISLTQEKEKSVINFSLEQLIDSKIRKIKYDVFIKFSRDFDFRKFLNKAPVLKTEKKFEQIKAER